MYIIDNKDKFMFNVPAFNYVAKEEFLMILVNHAAFMVFRYIILLDIYN
jgi:hypothetical protein